MAVSLKATVPAKFKNKLDDVIRKAAHREEFEDVGGTNKQPRTLNFRFRSQHDAWKASLRIRYIVSQTAKDDEFGGLTVTINIASISYKRV